VLGGSFNPPHIGHLIMAEEAARQFGYDAVVLVPALVPPHKALRCDPGADARLAMVRAAASDWPGFTVDDCELRRGGVSYTVDTLDQLRTALAPGDGLGLLIGDDLAAGFARWKDPEGVAARCEIVVGRRSGEPVVGFPVPYRAADNLLVPVSSSLVRARVASGGAWMTLVPPSVAAYIVEHELYRCR